MRFPNGFFGNGPGSDDDSPNQRELEAYQRSRIQFTVATSTFAGIALVGMFCSCIWFACCRNSSKTRKKGRTWATANSEAGLQNPYSYEGYVDSQGYMQMNNDGVSPYTNNPLYPSTIYGDKGLPNAYDFNEHFGFNEGGKTNMMEANSARLNNALMCGTSETNMKDIPPSYTALFFATQDSNGIEPGIKKVASATHSSQISPEEGLKVTNIQPIHLKVTSQAEKLQQAQQQGEDNKFEDFSDYHRREDPSNAPPVSLLSVESDPGENENGSSSSPKNGNENVDRNGNSTVDTSNDDDDGDAKGKPLPYNPGYKGYMKF